MIQTTQRNEDVGVIVARFQTPILHKAHVELINYVRERHSKTLIILGLSELRATENNPLDYETRREMLLEQFSDITVGYINDHPNDNDWSKRLDKTIFKLCNNGKLSAKIYGGRDSFIPYYKGKYQTEELVSDVIISGSQLRLEAGMATEGKRGQEFRNGVIWATQQRFPTVYSTVDIVPYNSEGKILLGRKTQDGNRYRMIGGFIDVGEKKIQAAKRELKEEAGDFEAVDFEFIDDFYVDDWRYRLEVDCILTNLFICRHVFGVTRAGDDLHEVRWFETQEVLDNIEKFVINGHQEPVKEAIKKIKTKI